jgi:hypothetical protein
VERATDLRISSFRKKIRVWFSKSESERLSGSVKGCCPLRGLVDRAIQVVSGSTLSAAHLAEARCELDHDFWLTKLNQFNGDYRNAEMVKAFLSSIEYRQRFGT